MGLGSGRGEGEGNESKVTAVLSPSRPVIGCRKGLRSWLWELDRSIPHIERLRVDLDGLYGRLDATKREMTMRERPPQTYHVPNSSFGYAPFLRFLVQWPRVGPLCLSH